MRLTAWRRAFVVRREPVARVLGLASPVILGSLSTTLLSTVIFAAGLAAYHAGLLSIERLSKLMGMPF